MDTEDESGWTPLLSAVSSEHTEVVKMLLETGRVDVKKKNETGRQAIHYAASKGNLEILSLLLQSGASVNARDKYGETPLHRAIQARNAENLVALLLEKVQRGQNLLLTTTKGAQVNAQNNQGDTPLHVACVEQNSRVIMQLVQAGADVELENKEGKNALDLLQKQKDTLHAVINLARKLHPKE